MATLLPVLAVALTASVVGAQPPAKPPAAVLDPVLVPNKFVAALVINPARLNSSAPATGMPIADFWKLIEGQTGLDPKMVERVVVYIDPLPGGNVAFFPAAAVRFGEGVAAKKQLIAALGEGGKQATAGGKAYVRSAKHQMAKVEISGYVADARTAVFAPWPTLETMLKSTGGGKHLLAAELAKADLDHDLVLVLTPVPLRKELETGLKEAPPAYSGSIRAALRLEVGVVAVDLSRDPAIRAEFRAADAEGAGVIHDELRRGLDQAKAAYPDLLKTLTTTLPPTWSKPLAALLGQTVTDPKLAKDGKTVTLTVARPKGWPAPTK